jgi:hypothetical protein
MNPMQAAMLPTNVVEILKVGLSGLCFLLSLLAFWLIHREQQRPAAPRKAILRSIYIFMVSNLLVAVLVALASYVGPRQTAAPQTPVLPLAQFEVVRARIKDLVEAKEGVLNRLLRESQLSETQKKSIEDTVSQLQGLDAKLEKAARGE